MEWVFHHGEGSDLQTQVKETRWPTLRVYMLERGIYICSMRQMECHGRKTKSSKKKKKIIITLDSGSMPESDHLEETQSKDIALSRLTRAVMCICYSHQSNAEDI